MSSVSNIVHKQNLEIKLRSKEYKLLTNCMGCCQTYNSTTLRFFFAPYLLSCDPDGIDHEDSYRLQSSRHHQSPSRSQWDDGFSCSSSCSRSSDDLPNTLSHRTKVELCPPKDLRRNYPPTVLQLMPKSGSSVGREAVLDIGQQGSWISRKQDILYSVLSSHTQTSCSYQGASKWWHQRPMCLWFLNNGFTWRRCFKTLVQCLQVGLS